jgi:hypothetical protein
MRQTQKHLSPDTLPSTVETVKTHPFFFGQLHLDALVQKHPRVGADPLQGLKIDEQKRGAVRSVQTPSSEVVHVMLIQFDLRFR